MVNPKPVCAKTIVIVGSPSFLPISTLYHFQTLRNSYLLSHMSDSVFNEEAGRFVSPKEAKTMKDTHRNAQLARGHKADEYTRSEFFGLNKIAELLKQPGCVGIRVHYANRWEDENGKPSDETKGRLKPRVLLTGVDARGRDLTLTGGLKDGGDGGVTVGDGFPCPQHCGNSN